jgi:hypothetical protein
MLDFLEIPRFGIVLLLFHDVFTRFVFSWGQVRFASSDFQGYQIVTQRAFVGFQASSSLICAHVATNLLIRFLFCYWSRL